MNVLPVVRNIGIFASFAALLALCSALGYSVMFTTLMEYDDEGCMLITLKLFSKGMPLYDEVFTMYGPFAFLAKWAIHAALGLSVSHDVGRIECLVLWLLAAALAAPVAWRLTGSAFAAWAAAFAVFRMLAFTVCEPGHPQEVCAPLLAAAVVIAAFVRRPALSATALAAVGGMLVMTKINVGVFFLMALGASMLVAGPRNRWFVVATVAYSACLVVSPFLLMKSQLHEPAYRDYAVNVSLSLAATMLLALAAPRFERFSTRQFASAGLATLLVVAAVSVATMLRGTSLHGLIHGAFLNGPKLGTNFLLPHAAFRNTWPISVTAFAAAGGVLALRRLGLYRTLAVDLALGLGRIALGVYVLAPLVKFAILHADRVFVGGPPLACALILPMLDGERDARECFARLFLAVLAITETLWAFPVAGSQIDFGAFLCAVAAVVVIHDGGTVVGQHVLNGSLQRPLRILLLASQGLVVVLLLDRLLTAERFYVKLYESNHSLTLPGSQMIRIPAHSVQGLRDVTAALKQNADTFISLPGVNSFYLWAQLAPPTGLNLTNWMYTFDERQQQRIIHAIAGRERVCALVNPRLFKFWAPKTDMDRLRKAAPLVRYIYNEFAQATTIGPFMICVRKGRSGASAQSATSGQSDGARPEPTMTRPPTF